MQKDNKLRCLVCSWIKPATMEDIEKEAKLMKGGKAYLFEAADGLPILRHEKGLKRQWEDREEKFIKRIL